ncbi:MAG: ABC transporter substrate-binding protein [Geminicoccaceae bacterium]|nr:ABC transporter substrate-binding protein [Geminicoccaceae bacterium]
MVRKHGWSAALFACAALSLASGADGEELGTLKIGVLEFGTVNWELDVIQHNDLDAKHGFELEVQGYGNNQATQVALRGDAVDGIVVDWLWVARQRSEGGDFVFVPYSTSVGSLMVPPDSGIADLGDLEGKTIGVAGGPLDKSWLLIQALARERHGIDLADAAEPAFGAPPLLNQKALDGELDAVLNYWHFSARLEARGFEELIGVDEVAAALGIEGEVPQLGYVFHESFADENEALVLAFVEASVEAKELLEGDEEWQRIRPLTKAEDDATFEALKRRFREGIPESFGESERTSAAELYTILADLGGEELVGPSKTLDPGTFWSRLTSYQ